MRIELTALAWEARVLPLYDARESRYSKLDTFPIQSPASFRYVPP